MYIYIYIYIYREREREITKGVLLMKGVAHLLTQPFWQTPHGPVNSTP